MKLPIPAVIVALLMATTVFAELPAVNVRFDTSIPRNGVGLEAKNMTVGENYFFTLRLFDADGQETSGSGSARCVVTGGLGEANATINACYFHAKKAGEGTLTYFYRASNFGYDLSATINITVEPARCAIIPKLQAMHPMQEKEIAADCSSLNGTRTDCPELQWNGTGGNFSNQHEINRGLARAQAVDYTSSRYAGNYKLYAISGEPADPNATYCEMALEVLPGSASKVAISQNSATALEVGQAVSFAALVTDIYGNSINDSTAWSVNGSIGNISSDGVFTAAQAGRGMVKATAACEFMAAGCPSASVEVVVVRKAAQQEIPPAPPSASLAQPPASGQQQSQAAGQQGNGTLVMAVVAIAAAIGLAAAMFMFARKKKR
ncbi:MAG: hypothetical protein WCY41_06190 [Candidatus Micrarchaeia archaeon]